MSHRVIVFCALAGGSLLLTQPSLAAPDSLTAVDIPPRISCEQEDSSSILSRIDVQMRRHEIKPSAASVQWLRSMGEHYAVAQTAGSDLPLEATDEAARVAALAQRGLVVAAAMAHEEAAIQSDAYRNSAFSRLAKEFVARSIQPVPHDEEHSAESEPDLLEQIAAQVAQVRTRIGDVYDWRPVRFFILGHAYDDPIAVAVSRQMLCDRRLSVKDTAKVEQAAAQVKTVIVSHRKSPQ